MELLEVKQKRTLRREEAAKLLRQLADAMERHNKLRFTREGIKFVVDVADEVEMEIELEVKDDGSSLEIEIDW
ncbi:MAG TPA: amphi-Trp domain-containing protein [Alcanivoracaceae bacterium]|nr:amphi-Trp domain-containing protein [Alcanivoracaceae bacterium]